MQCKSLSGVSVAVTDPGFDHRVHWTAPPGSEDLEQPDLEFDINDGTQIAPMVASGIRRYERMVSR
jgi:hypothetical protein